MVATLVAASASSLCLGAVLGSGSTHYSQKQLSRQDDDDTQQQQQSAKGSDAADCRGFLAGCFAGVSQLKKAAVSSSATKQSAAATSTPPTTPQNDQKAQQHAQASKPQLRLDTESCQTSGVQRLTLLPSPGGPRAAVRSCSGKVCRLGEHSQCNRVMLCMVGLPARGKSYIVKMLQRYLRWTGFPVQAFNAGNLRRKEGMAGASADFFSSTQGSTACLRERIAMECLEQCFEWLENQQSSSVAIFDATNTTKGRRQKILERGQLSPDVCIVFVENICDDPKILEANYEMKLQNDDYKGMDPLTAQADFLKRVEAYEQRYQTIEDDEFEGDISYLKLYNVGRKVVMHQCEGYITSHVGFYLSNIHISPRRIWLVRSAETEKGHPRRLSQDGSTYSRSVATMLRGAVDEMAAAGEDEGSHTIILTGTDMCHGATMRAICGEYSRGCSSDGLLSNLPVMTTSLLNDLDQGDLNGMKLPEIQQEYPEVWEERERDVLHFRYPGHGGESYLDVVGRLRPVIIELERQRHSVLVVASPAVKRCLHAYFTGCDMETMPHLLMDDMAVHELRPSPHGTKVATVELPPVESSFVMAYASASSISTTCEQPEDAEVSSLASSSSSAESVRSAAK
eukprot:TRINITY_DN1005_c0_g1_i3.p1 TRINITY_DN1005_c0_g1~~TRINITY_DN1005_c0_g1_i3.p1  ORF type:complete len:625 (-),score=114.95 TRINITY_DN1005_c0_g1_i3:1006-2880(-)